MIHGAGKFVDSAKSRLAVAGAVCTPDIVPVMGWEVGQSARRTERQTCSHEYLIRFVDKVTEAETTAEGKRCEDEAEEIINMV